MTTQTPARSRLLPLQGLVLGLLAGAVVGALARVWMRLVTTERPEFSWSGTLFILTAFGIAGGLAGALAGAHRRRWRGRPMTALRAVGLVAVLPLGSGAGIVLLPTLVLGGLAAGRTSWPRAVRSGVAGLALVPVLLVHGQAWRDGLGTGRALLALLLCLLVYGCLAVAVAQPVRPVAGRPAVGGRTLVLLGVVLAAVVAGLPAVGFPGLLVGATLLGLAVLLPRAVARLRRQDLERTGAGPSAGAGTSAAPAASAAPDGTTAGPAVPGPRSAPASRRSTSSGGGA